MGSMLFSSWKEWKKKKTVSSDCIQEIVPFIIFLFYTLYKKQMYYLITNILNNIREFLGGPVARKLYFSMGSIPGQGTKIPQAMKHSQNKQINK